MTTGTSYMYLYYNDQLPDEAISQRLLTRSDYSQKTTTNICFLSCTILVQM